MHRVRADNSELCLLYAADPHSASDKTSRRAKSARPHTLKRPGQSMTDSGRTSCCFNLRRTACLCATSQGFAGDLGGVIEDCVFSRAMVNAAPIAGPSPAERNKLERYRRSRSAAAAVGPATAAVCLRSAARTPRARLNAFWTPQRSRRRGPASATGPATSTALSSGSAVEEPGRRVNPLAEMLSHLYRTYGYQFTSSYRLPAASLLHSPATSRPAGGEPSDDDATAIESTVPHTATISMLSRRADRDRSSTRSIKRITSSPTRRLK